MPDDDQLKQQRQSQEQGQGKGQATGQPQAPGEPSPGLKDRDAETSDSYGNTRESGETPK
ncbi:MAG: hypothetical protein EOP80_20805 [Variovorax sp.]|nr:MAG: hypothetical protein EOP80_20805 [Variovorax sp.]